MTPGSDQSSSGGADLTPKREFNLDEAADYLGMKRRAMVELCNDKGHSGIRHERIGYRSYKFLHKDLDKFIEKRRHTPPEKKSGKYANSP